MFWFKKNKMPFEKEVKRIRKIIPTIENKTQNELIYYINKTKKDINETTLEKFDKRNLNQLEERKHKIFAVGIEVIKRTLGLSLFDVQIAGALALTERNIIEMKTGEGKTVTAILSAFWGHVENLQTYVITVNEYLSRRDYLQAKQVFDYMNMGIGYISSSMFLPQKQENYKNKVVYITNTEFAFDYLRDNIAKSKEHLMQGAYDFLIIDEADLVLLDEARNPCILASEEFDNSYYFHKAKEFMSFIDKKDYEISNNGRNATLTNSGYNKAFKFFGHELIENVNLFNAVCQSLLAHFVFRKDVDYLVKDDEVQIIDKYTGRVLEGRRYQNGLHQAIEAKENVTIKTENLTVGSITYQNLFKKFVLLSGMTGTALQAEREFSLLYGVGVITVPTNRPMIRKDYDDILFRTKTDKYDELLKMVTEKHEKGQPILIGTTSVRESKDIAKMFYERGILFQLLNAKNDKEEDLMVERAGEKGMITISTNMAGRGTDIKISDEVEALGGLCVIGTSRNESKRIDLQLRGRSGRQGQIGESIYLISGEDEVFKRYENQTFNDYFEKVSSKCPVEGKKVTKMVDYVQKNIESIHEKIRLTNCKIDQIINVHRDYFYKIRCSFLEENASLTIFESLIETIVDDRLIEFTNKPHISLEEYCQFADNILNKYGIDLDLEKQEHYKVKIIKKKTIEKMKKNIKALDAIEDVDRKHKVQQYILEIFDKYWASYLSQVDYQKHAYGFSMIGVQNPEQQFSMDLDKIFKEIFKDMVDDILSTLFKTVLNNTFVYSSKIIEIEDFDIDEYIDVGIEDLLNKQTVNVEIENRTSVVVDRVIENREDIVKLVNEFCKDDGFYTINLLSENEILYSNNLIKNNDKYILI